MSKIAEAVGSGSGNVDWNQNDETAPDYVKNRTHYESIAVVSEIEVPSGATSASVTMPAADYVFGNTYTIICNGVEYELQLGSQFDMGPGEYYLGFNLKNQDAMWAPVMGADSPFMLASFSRVYPEPSIGEVVSCEFTVYFGTGFELPAIMQIVGYSIHKIDSKYLPSKVFVIDATASDYSTTDSVYGNAIKEALLDGKIVYYYDGGNYFSTAAFRIIESTTGNPSLNIWVTGKASTTGGITFTSTPYSFLITR